MKSHIILLLYIVVRSVSGQLNYHQDHILSDGYKPSKIHVKQDGRHQPEYYNYEPPCPDAEDIAPCVCTYDTVSNAMDLNCSAVENEEQLKQIFKADFPFKNFRKFHIEHNNNLKVLEAGVFNGISFEEIQISFTDLEVVELQALDSCYETTTELYLYYNKITSFPFDELSQFSKLRDFDISNNLLSVIPADAFHGLTALEYLDIGANNADIVGTFQDLPNLLRIYLDSNNITTTIPAQFIKTGSSHLSYINLYNNNIVSIEPGAFDIVNWLDINMYGNSLSTLDEATWRPHLEAGGTLDNGVNPLVCGCDIAWLFAEDYLLWQVDYNAMCTDGAFMFELNPKMFVNC
ncbi:unnamed protein product [Meganyctiphanes norvegica]|uniref:Oplophorus-luciferin 2-monooxygenase non-catalytic subunit n=1 Tax=Meganyctiphanes norvegica TaxID=48144 RepID=A0AAV2R462_MEGNR